MAIDFKGPSRSDILAESPSETFSRQRLKAEWLGWLGVWGGGIKEFSKIFLQINFYNFSR